MYFLAKCTDKKETFSKPPKNGDRYVGSVEEMFIEKGIKKNPELMNFKNTAIPKNLVVEGIYGQKGPGKPAKHITQFKKLFGF